ncbi:MAG: hypothetical protein ACREND_13775 [Gemmatimonadaceae bacterium]
MLFSRQQCESWLRRGSVVAGVLATSVALAQPAHAQKDMASCKVVFDASAKMITTPSHLYMTMNLGNGKPITSESISTGKVMYVLIDGKWTRSPLTVQDNLAREQANIKNATAYSCHKLRSESVSGVTATVYSAHEANEAGASDSQIWIANGTGLPLKIESHLAGGGTASSRIDYAHITAPAGVQ